MMILLFYFYNTYWCILISRYNKRKVENNDL